MILSIPSAIPKELGHNALIFIITADKSHFSNFLMWSRYLIVHLHVFCSHSALEEPRGTSTVRNEPGVRDITTCSVIP
jgi:hypothetical protein